MSCLAKSGRSGCQQASGAAIKHDEDDEKAVKIALGELRCGSLDSESGTYGRWHHLACWRVPASIWMGLPEQGASPAAFEAALLGMQQLSLCGFAELPPEQRALLVAHVMDASNHARPTKKAKARHEEEKQARKQEQEKQEQESKPARGGGGAAAAAAATEPSSQALVRSGGGASSGDGGLFVVPRPGVNGALASSLSGKTFVLTGTFPELGGGAALDQVARSAAKR